MVAIAQTICIITSLILLIIWTWNDVPKDKHNTYLGKCANKKCDVCNLKLKKWFEK